jgi:hypothetical protein
MDVLLSSIVDNTVHIAQNSQIKTTEEKDIIEPDKLIKTPLDEALSVASQWLIKGISSRTTKHLCAHAKFRAM